MIIPNITKAVNNDQIRILYNTAAGTEVTFEIYNTAGDLVNSLNGTGAADGQLNIGNAWLNSDNKLLTSGIYLVIMKVDGELQNNREPQRFGWIK